LRASRRAARRRARLLRSAGLRADALVADARDGARSDPGAARWRPADGVPGMAVDLLGPRGLRNGVADSGGSRTSGEPCAGAPAPRAARIDPRDLPAPADRPRVHEPCPDRWPHLLGTPGLHLGIAFRVHRAVSRLTAALRPVLRRERDRDHRGVTGEWLAGDEDPAGTDSPRGAPSVAHGERVDSALGRHRNRRVRRYPRAALRV